MDLDHIKPSVPLAAVARVRSFSSARSTTRCDRDGLSVRLAPLVTDRGPWLEANFKETDLTHVTAGQKAKVVLDMHPDVTWDAEVESISPATGAEFAILPAQNASGNWVKVVQRLPVRLRLIEQPGEPPLRAGMTAHVSIDTGRTRSLSSLLGGGSAIAARPKPQQTIKTE